MKGEINTSAELTANPKYCIAHFVLPSLFFPQARTEKTQLIFLKEDLFLIKWFRDVTWSSTKIEISMKIKQIVHIKISFRQSIS